MRSNEAHSLMHGVSAHMPATFPNLVLGSSTLLLCYVIILVRMMAQHFWMIVAETSSALTPGPTSFAIRHYWVFLVLLVSIAGTAGAICRYRPASAGRSLLLGLASHGFVVWVAMVCYFFDYFLDEMHSYRGPRFDPERFLSVGAGAFPLTLLTLCVLVLVTLCRRGAKQHLPATPQ